MKKSVSIFVGLLVFASTAFAQSLPLNPVRMELTGPSLQQLVQNLPFLETNKETATRVVEQLAPSAEQMALSPGFEMLQRAEVKANAVSVRNDTPIMMEHYEIPLSMIKQDLSKNISPEIYNALVFERDGQKFLRWIINPEDSLWHLEVAKWLEANGQSSAKGKHFVGYQTASRSYIVRDPVSGVEFSAKVSTNKTGGFWADKKQTWEDAWQVRMAYQYVEDVINERGGLKNSVWISEPAAFGIEPLDQGMLIRSYESLTKTNTFLIPGFSALHEQFGAQIAALNGSNDPAAFWNEHYNKPLARALAEVYALTGMQYDSPHSQNFMVELDANLRPTGRIGLRDMGDSYMTTDVFKAADRLDIPKRWEADNILDGYMAVSAGLLHGNNPPSWMNTDAETPADHDGSYNKWGYDFYTAFEAEFYNITGVDLTARMGRSGNYFSKSYRLNTEAGKAYLNWVSEGRHVLSPACMDTFAPAI